MSKPIFFLLFLSLNSVLIFGNQERFEQMCETFAAYFNIVNKLTPMSLEVDFEKGNSVLSKKAKMEFSPTDIHINCTLIDITNCTHLANAVITSDFVIYTSDRREVKVHDGVIVISYFLAKLDEILKLETLSIEMTAFDEATVEIDGEVESIASDQIIPFLSRALRRSVLFWDAVIKQKSSKETKHVNKLFHETLKYYFSKIAIDS